MAVSEWLSFFEDAGIPPGPALGYAVTFVDNRIHKNMLLDLTKELMQELGVTALGDVIAILRHAKVVHRQELCRAASQSLQPEPPSERGPGGGSRRDRPRGDRDRARDRAQDRDRPCGAAGRMITNSLRRDPLKGSPQRIPPGTGISVTVANGASEDALPSSSVFPKRRRVTAEPPGGLERNLPEKPQTPRSRNLPQFPEVTTSRNLPESSGASAARTRNFLELQGVRVLSRPSVFERLGAEAKAAGGKPSGVFSRLGEPLPPRDPCDPVDPLDPEALPYAGVLKKRREGSGSSAQDGAVSSSGGGGASVFCRLGRKPD